MIGSLGGVDDAVVVDLYAGSGSFGIESLSRGARHVTFVERARPALDTLKANLEITGFESQTTVLAGSAPSIAATLDPVDIAFCDPPYADDVWSTLFDVVRSELLVGHAPSPIELASGWVEVRRRTYGRAHILIARKDSVHTD